ncbi:MAG: cupredoxin domain-containing protein, partial [Candidatus Limnocylindria bacterium]
PPGAGMMRVPLSDANTTVSEFVERTPPQMNLSLFALRRGALLTLTMLLAFALVACSSGDGDASEPAGSSGDAGGGTATVSGGAVEITAADLAFSATTIQATAEAFTITLVNNDTVPHNISIYTEEGGDRLVEGTVVNAGETVEVQVEALDAGEYYFVCDIHPDDMNGTVVVG